MKKIIFAAAGAAAVLLLNNAAFAQSAPAYDLDAALAACQEMNANPTEMGQCERHALAHAHVDEAFSSGGEATIHIDENHDNDSEATAASKASYNAALDECRMQGDIHAAKECQREATRTFNDGF